MYHQLLAQKGYIVISVDTRGTMNRGAAFKKCTYLQLGKLETEDMIAVASEKAPTDDQVIQKLRDAFIKIKRVNGKNCFFLY